MPDVANLSRFLGRGVYYAATHLEATLCAAEDVAVVGGGNSAGQAAVFLAGPCRHVHMLVRSDGLAESMSRYLIRRIQDTPKITLHTGTQLTAFEGSDRLERVSWKPRNGESVVHDLKHTFLMTGAQPHTRWLQGCVVLDDHGFVKTGPDLGKEQLAAAHWNLPRPPYLLESSVPGVFAAVTCAPEASNVLLRPWRGIDLRTVRASSAARIRRGRESACERGPITLVHAGRDRKANRPSLTLQSCTPNCTPEVLGDFADP